MPLLNFREHGYSAMYFKPWNKELLFKKKERISKQINQDLEGEKKTRTKTWEPVSCRIKEERVEDLS